MLDSLFKVQIAPVMNSWATRVLQSGLTANKLTLIGFVFGISGCFAVGMQSYALGLILILFNRFFDGLAGAVARTAGRTALGSYIDTLCDFLLYAGFVFFFSLGVPESGLAAAALLFSYLAMMAAYLAQTTFMARPDALDTPRGGLVENGEMIVFMTACCLYAPAFPAIAVLFSLLCWTTALIRIVIAVKTFKA